MYTKINRWTKRRLLRVSQFTKGLSLRQTMSNDARQQREVNPNAEARGDECSFSDSFRTEDSSAETRNQEDSSREGYHQVKDALLPLDLTSVDGGANSDGTSSACGTKHIESTLEQDAESGGTDHSHDLSPNTSQTGGGTVSARVLRSPEENSSNEMQRQHSAELSTFASVLGLKRVSPPTDHSFSPGKYVNQDEFPPTDRCSGSSTVNPLSKNEPTTALSQDGGGLSNNATEPVNAEFSTTTQSEASTSADKSHSHTFSIQGERNAQLDACRKRDMGSNNVTDALSFEFSETAQSEESASVLHEPHSHLIPIIKEKNSGLGNCSKEDANFSKNECFLFSGKDSTPAEMCEALDLSFKTGVPIDGAGVPRKTPDLRIPLAIKKESVNNPTNPHAQQDYDFLNFYPQGESQSHGFLVGPDLGAHACFLSVQDTNSAVQEAARIFPNMTLSEAVAANVPFVDLASPPSPSSLAYVTCEEDAENLDPKECHCDNEMAECLRPDLEGCSGEHNRCMLGDDKYVNVGEMNPLHLSQLDVIQAGPLKGLQIWTQTRSCADSDFPILNYSVPENFKPPTVSEDDDEEKLLAAIKQVDSTRITDILQSLDKCPLDKTPGSLRPVEMSAMLLFNRHPPVYNTGDTIHGDLHIFLDHSLEIFEIKIRYHKEIFNKETLHFISRDRQQIWSGGTLPPGHTVMNFTFQLPDKDHGDFFLSNEVGIRYMVYMETFGIHAIGLAALGDFKVVPKPLSFFADAKEKTRDASGSYVSVSTRRLKDRQLDLHVSIDRPCVEIDSDLSITVEACEALKDTGISLQVFPVLQQTVTMPVFEKKFISEPVSMEHSVRKLRYAKDQIRTKTFRIRVEGDQLLPSHPATTKSSTEMTIEHAIKVYVKRGSMKHEAVSLRISVFPKVLIYRMVDTTFIGSGEDEKMKMNGVRFNACMLISSSAAIDNGLYTMGDVTEAPLVPVFELGTMSKDAYTDKTFMYKAKDDPKLWWYYAGVNTAFYSQKDLPVLDDRGLQMGQNVPRSTAGALLKKMQWLGSNVAFRDNEYLMTFFNECKKLLNRFSVTPRLAEHESGETNNQGENSLVESCAQKSMEEIDLVPGVSDAKEVPDVADSYLYLLDEPDEGLGDKPLSAMSKKERKKWRKLQKKLENGKEEKKKTQSKKGSGPKITDKPQPEEVSSCSALESDSNFIAAVAAAAAANPVSAGKDKEYTNLAKGKTKECGKAGETGNEFDDLGFKPVSGKREKKKRKKQKKIEQTEAALMDKNDNEIEETENDRQRNQQVESQKVEEGDHLPSNPQELALPKADFQREGFLLDSAWPSLSEAALAASSSFTASAASTPRRNKSRMQSNRDTIAGRDVDRTLETPATPTSWRHKSVEEVSNDDAGISSKFAVDEESGHASDVLDGNALPSPIIDDAKFCSNVPQHKERACLDDSDSVKPETEIIATVFANEAISDVDNDGLKRSKKKKKSKKQNKGVKLVFTDVNDEETSAIVKDQEESETIGEKIEIRTDSEKVQTGTTAGSSSSQSTISSTEFVSQVGGDSTTNLETATEECEPEVPDVFVLDGTWPSLSTEHRSISDFTGDDARGTRPSNSHTGMSWADTLSAPKTQATATEAQCQRSLEAKGATICENSGTTTETPGGKHAGWLRKSIKRKTNRKECSANDNISKTSPTAATYAASGGETPQYDHTGFPASPVITKLEGRSESSTDVKEREAAPLSSSSCYGRSSSESLPSSWGVSTDFSDTEKRTVESLKTSSEYTSEDIPENLPSRALDKESCNTSENVYPDVFLTSHGTTCEVQNIEQQVDVVSSEALLTTTKGPEEANYFPKFHDKKENVFTFDNINTILENSENVEKSETMKEEKQDAEGISRLDFAREKASEKCDRSHESKVFDSSAVKTSNLYTWGATIPVDRDQRLVVDTDRLVIANNSDVSNTKMHQLGENGTKERDSLRPLDEAKLKRFNSQMHSEAETFLPKTTEKTRSLQKIPKEVYALKTETNNEESTLRDEKKFSEEISRKYKERREVEGRSYDGRIRGAGQDCDEISRYDNPQTVMPMHENIFMDKARPIQTDDRMISLQNEHTSTQVLNCNDLSKKSRNALLLPTITETSEMPDSATQTFSGMLKAANCGTDVSQPKNTPHYESSANSYNQYSLPVPSWFHTSHNGNGNRAQHILPPQLHRTAEDGPSVKHKTSQYLPEGLIIPKHNAELVGTPKLTAHVDSPHQRESSKPLNPNAPSFYGRSLPEQIGGGNAFLNSRNPHEAMTLSKSGIQSEPSVGIQSCQIQKRTLNNPAQPSHFDNPRNKENVPQKNAVSSRVSFVRRHHIYDRIGEPWDVRRSYDIYRMRSGIWSVSKKNIWANAKDVFGDPVEILACPEEFRRPPTTARGNGNAPQSLASLAANSTLNPRAPAFSVLNPNAPSFQSNKQAGHFNPDAVDQKTQDGRSIVRNLNGVLESIYGSQKDEILEERMRHVEQRIGQLEVEADKSRVSEMTKPVTLKSGRSYLAERPGDSSLDSVECSRLTRPLHPPLSGFKQQSSQDSARANILAVTALYPGLTPALQAVTARRMAMLLELRNEQASRQKENQTNWRQVRQIREDTTPENGLHSLQEILRQQMQRYFQQFLQRSHDHEDLKLKEDMHAIHIRHIKRQPENQNARSDSLMSPTHPFRRLGPHSRTHS